MKVFFRKISFFLVVIFVIWFLMECFYRFVPNNYTEKHKNVQKHYNNFEVLIFGNSHAFYGLNPKHFDKTTFNIANISQSIYFDKLLFDRHIDNFKNLKYVILNVEYTSLSQQDNTQEDVWRKYFYHAQMDLDVSIIPFYDIRQYSLALSRSFKNSVNTVNQYLKNGTIAECDQSGWGNIYTYQNRRQNLDELAVRVTEKHEDNSMDFKINTQRIKSIIKKCKEKNINVILVTMPVHKSYSEKVNPKKANAIFAVAQNLARENPNAFYINLFYNKNFSDEDFYDPDHLNDRGAKKCSILLNEFIEQND
ncbi:MAG: hypothetical protein AB7D46_11260 [Flavobacteriaceae bacterium]